MLKVAVVVLTVMLAYAAIYSLMSIVAPTVVMKSGVKAAIGKTLDNARDDGYLKSLTVGQRNTGIFALASVVSGFFVLFAAFQKAQKWAWWAFLVVAGIAWLGGLIVTITIADKTNAIMQSIGLVLFLVGIIIPVRAFFVKAAEEAPQEAQETQE
jgi:hypothetical protein